MGDGKGKEGAEFWPHLIPGQRGQWEPPRGRGWQVSHCPLPILSLCICKMERQSLPRPPTRTQGGKPAFLSGIKLLKLVQVDRHLEIMSPFFFFPNILLGEISNAARLKEFDSECKNRVRSLWYCYAVRADRFIH